MTIELQQLSKYFGEQLVVNKVSLSVENGELFVLLGSSGSGKSTILRLIAGLLQPDEGRIWLHERDVTDLPPQKRDTGFVFQNYAIFRHMTVAANVEFGLRIRSVPAAERRARRNELLELVGLGGLGARRPNQLSGGQRQRVALARALAYRPAVLLLDEPFGALDLRIRLQLRATLKDIQKKLGVTTILVTHDQEEAFELANRVAVLEKGRLVEIGAPEDLYWRPRSDFSAAFLGGGNVVVGRAAGGAIQVGSANFDFPREAPPHEEGAPVRILFRPETVRYQSEPFGLASGVKQIGLGRVVEHTFAGSLERLRFELDSLQGARAAAPALRYDQHLISVVAAHTTKQREREQVPKIGEERWVGCSDFHVLDPWGLHFLTVLAADQPDPAAMAVGRDLALAAHGHLTLVMLSPNEDRLDQDRAKLRELAAPMLQSGDPKLELINQAGHPAAVLIREIQQNAPDLVILARDSGSEPGGQKAPAALARRLLLSGRVTVMLAPAAAAPIKRLLVCTAAGEPGKSDVRFAARLARHIKAAITVFHVVREDSSEGDRRLVAEHLEQACGFIRAHNLECDSQISAGAVVEAIRQQAQAGAYDLIVIGAPQNPLSQYRAAADIVTRIAFESAAAVLIVPMEEYPRGRSRFN